jgi:SAM-dependent methyltransferase
MKNPKQDKAIEKEFWNEEALKEKYLHYEKGVYCAFRETEYDTIFKKAGVKILPGMAAVDIGCAGGVSTCLLAENGGEVIGFDISPLLIEKANEYAKTAKGHPSFFVADAEKIPLEDSSCDLCFLSGVLHHFPDNSQILKEITRVLKPEGRLLAVEPNLLNISYRASFWLSRRGGETSPNEYPISPLKLKGKLEKDFYNFEIAPFRVNDVPVLRQLGLNKIGWIYNILQKTIIGMNTAFTPTVRHGTFFILSCKKRGQSDSVS